MDYVVVQHRGKEACNMYTYFKKPKPHTLECRICHRRFRVVSLLEFLNNKRLRNAMVMIKEVKNHQAARQLIKRLTEENYDRIGVRS